LRQAELCQHGRLVGLRGGAGLDARPHQVELLLCLPDLLVGQRQLRLRPQEIDIVRRDLKAQIDVGVIHAGEGAPLAGLACRTERRVCP